jgi:hypothetical protein
MRKFRKEEKSFRSNLGSYNTCSLKHLQCRDRQFMLQGAYSLAWGPRGVVKSYICVEAKIKNDSSPRWKLRRRVLLCKLSGEVRAA